MQIDEKKTRMRAKSPTKTNQSVQTEMFMAQSSNLSGSNVHD